MVELLVGFFIKVDGRCDEALLFFMARPVLDSFLKKKKKKKKGEVKATWQTRGIIPIPAVAYTKFTCSNKGMIPNYEWLSFLKLEWFSLILCFDFNFLFGILFCCGLYIYMKRYKLIHSYLLYKDIYNT